MIYEDDAGVFHEITYAGSSTTNIWNTETFDQAGEGLSGSGLAELTTTPNYTSLTLFYQTNEGQLVQRVRDSGASIWSAGECLQPFDIN